MMRARAINRVSPPARKRLGPLKPVQQPVDLLHEYRRHGKGEDYGVGYPVHQGLEAERLAVPAPLFVVDGE